MAGYHSRTKARRPFYDPSKHHSWTLAFKVYMRASEPLALQILEGVHERPEPTEEKAPTLQRTFVQGTGDLITATLEVDESSASEEEDMDRLSKQLELAFDQTISDDSTIMMAGDPEPKVVTAAVTESKAKTPEPRDLAGSATGAATAAAGGQKADEQKPALPTMRKTPAEEKAQKELKELKLRMELQAQTTKKLLSHTISGMRKKRRKKRTLAQRLVDRQKEVAYLCQVALSREAFLSLKQSLQRVLWATANTRAYTELELALTSKHQYLMGLTPIGDGLAGWTCLLQRFVEQSAASKSQYLMDLMNLKFESTGTASAPASMRTFAARLQQLDALYAQSNGGNHLAPEMMRLKLKDLPARYDSCITYLEDRETDARENGSEPPDCAKIISYVIGWEKRHIRRREQVTYGFGGRRSSVKRAPARHRRRRPKALLIQDKKTKISSAFMTSRQQQP